MDQTSGVEAASELVADLVLPELDPAKVDNKILREALERVQGHTSAPIHMGHYTKHSSHASHSKSTW